MFHNKSDFVPFTAAINVSLVPAQSSDQGGGISIPETKIKLQVPKYKQIILSRDLPNVVSQRLFKKCIRRFGGSDDI